MSGSSTRDWDAATYQRVSVPHEEWARSILDRLELAGDERVLDAGCGSGRVTAMLIERLPEGSVVAVDGSPSMVEEVRSVLRPRDEALVSDLIGLRLERAGRRRLLERGLPLGARSRRALSHACTRL